MVSEVPSTMVSLTHSNVNSTYSENHFVSSAVGRFTVMAKSYVADGNYVTRHSPGYGRHPMHRGMTAHDDLVCIAGWGYGCGIYRINDDGSVTERLQIRYPNAAYDASNPTDGTRTYAPGSTDYETSAGSLGEGRYWTSAECIPDKKHFVLGPYTSGKGLVVIDYSGIYASGNSDISITTYTENNCNLKYSQFGVSYLGGVGVSPRESGTNNHWVWLGRANSNAPTNEVITRYDYVNDVYEAWNVYNARSSSLRYAQPYYDAQKDTMVYKVYSNGNTMLIFDCSTDAANPGGIGTTGNVAGATDGSYQLNETSISMGDDPRGYGYTPYVATSGGTASVVTVSSSATQQYNDVISMGEHRIRRIKTDRSIGVAGTTYSSTPEIRNWASRNNNGNSFTWNPYRAWPNADDNTFAWFGTATYGGYGGQGVSASGAGGPGLGCDDIYPNRAHIDGYHPDLGFAFIPYYGDRGYIEYMTQAWFDQETGTIVAPFSEGNATWDTTDGNPLEYDYNCMPVRVRSGGGTYYWIYAGYSNGDGSYVYVFSDDKGKLFYPTYKVAWGPFTLDGSANVGSIQVGNISNTNSDTFDGTGDSYLFPFTIPSDCSISFDVSNNGGSSWESYTLGTQHIFNTVGNSALFRVNATGTKWKHPYSIMQNTPFVRINGIDYPQPSTVTGRGIINSVGSGRLGGT